MLGYRFEHNKGVWFYCVDTGGHSVSRTDLGEDLPMYQNVDVMVLMPNILSLKPPRRWIGAILQPQ